MVSYRVLVTGSRTWTDETPVRHAFTLVNQRNVNPLWPVTLIHGDANGLDKMVARIARDEFGWTVETYPAEWSKHDFTHRTHSCPGWHEGKPVCKMAGHRRNSDMVATRADVCFAFIKYQSAGATGCAKLAEAAGIPTEYYRYPLLT